MSKIYIFSGLGVDKRVFDKIDFKDHDVKFVNWIPPKPNESIEAYAKRISEPIKEEKPILIGLSFGGIVAVEIAKRISVEKLILIASAKSKYELPFIYRFAGKLRLDESIPTRLMKQSNLFTYYLFGVKSKEDKMMLDEILKETDPYFLKWAISKIVRWENFILPSKYFHVHGDADRIIPIKNVEVSCVVEGGGHFMTITRSKEVEKILLEVLDNKT